MEIRPIYSRSQSYSYLTIIDSHLRRKSFYEADAQLIKDFVSFKIATSNIKEKRTHKISERLCLFRARFLECDFPEVTDQLWITSAGLMRSHGYAQNTLRDMILISRSFLLWLQDSGLNKHLTKDGIMKVNIPPLKRITKTPDQLLTDEEVLAMLHHPSCKPVTAALIAVLYYTGMRPSEALSLRWRDLEFSNRLLKIRITDTKTGKFRYAPCSEALEQVAYWRNHYPAEISGGPEGENPVFVNRVSAKANRLRPYGSMNWYSANTQIRTVSKAAIGKEIKLYVFRGSDITNSAVKGVPDSVNKAIHWGNQSTSMLSTYLLLKDNQIDQAILKRAGIEDETEEEVSMKPILCNKCYTMNQAGSEYCRTCGEPLTRASMERQRHIREQSEDQQKGKDMGAMVKDVAEVFGMTVEEFTAKMMKIKNL